MSQLLRGRNNNQFFHYCGLLHDLLYRQDLPNKWFERRLKRLAKFISIFGKGISLGWFYCSNSQGNFKTILKLSGYQQFRFPVYDLSLLSGVFFQQLLLKIQNHTDEELQPALHIQESFRGALQKFHQLH